MRVFWDFFVHCWGSYLRFLDTNFPLLNHTPLAPALSARHSTQAHCWGLIAPPALSLGLGLSPSLPLLWFTNTLTCCCRNNPKHTDESRCCSILLWLHCWSISTSHPSLILCISQSGVRPSPFCDAICFGAHKHLLILSLFWTYFDHIWHNECSAFAFLDGCGF